jgi:hypothetical protein
MFLENSRMLFNLRFGGLIILCFAFFYLYCFYNGMSRINLQKISDHQQSWGYEEGPWKGPGPRSAGGR